MIEEKEKNYKNKDVVVKKSKDIAKGINDKNEGENKEK